MSTLQNFHRFRDLPRELQLHIWEFYELTQPHNRHYFRKMKIWSGRLYASADQHTNRRISNIAGTGDPRQTPVPDVAVAPETKIQLPSNAGSDPHWVSQDAVPTAETFCAIQVPRSMTSPVHIWVNLKHDEFCFARASGDDGRGGKNFLQYLEGPSGLQLLTTSRWFFRIQRLVLIKSAAIQTLGPFDRVVFGMHPSLREITIVAVLDDFHCSHLALGTRQRPHNSSAVERLPLGTFLSLWQEVTGSCACDRPMRCLGELEQLRWELIELYQNRASTRPPVGVGIEVEVYPYWNQGPDIEGLVIGDESP